MISVRNSRNKLSSVCMMVLLGLSCVYGDLHAVGMPDMARDGGDSASGLDGFAKPDERVAPTQWTFEVKVAHFASNVRVRGLGDVNDLLINRVNYDRQNPRVSDIRAFLHEISIVEGSADRSQESLRCALLVRAVEALGEAVQAMLCKELEEVHRWINYWQWQLDNTVSAVLSKWPHRWLKSVRRPASHEADIRDRIEALCKVRDYYRCVLGRVVIALDRFDPTQTSTSVQYQWMATVFSKMQELCDGGQEVAAAYESLSNGCLKLTYTLERHPSTFHAQLAPHTSSIFERYCVRGALMGALGTVATAFGVQKKKTFARWGENAWSYVEEPIKGLRDALSSGNGAAEEHEKQRDRFAQAIKGMNEGIASLNRLFTQGAPDADPNEAGREQQEQERRARQEQYRQEQQDPGYRAKQEREHIAELASLQERYRHAVMDFRNTLSPAECAEIGLDGFRLQKENATFCGPLPQPTFWGLREEKETNEHYEGRRPRNVQEFDSFDDKANALNLEYLEKCMSYALERAKTDPNLVAGGLPSLNRIKSTLPLAMLSKDIGKARLKRFQTSSSRDIDAVLKGLTGAIDAAQAGIDAVWGEANKAAPQLKALTALVSTIAVGMVGAGVIYGAKRLVGYFRNRSTMNYKRPAKYALDEVSSVLLVAERDGANRPIRELGELAVGTLVDNGQRLLKYGRVLVDQGVRGTFDEDVAQLKSTAGWQVRSKVRWARYMTERYNPYLG